MKDEAWRIIAAKWRGIDSECVLYHIIADRYSNLQKERRKRRKDKKEDKTFLTVN